MSKKKKNTLGLKEWRKENYPHHEGTWYYQIIEDALEEAWEHSDKTMHAKETLLISGKYIWHDIQYTYEYNLDRWDRMEIDLGKTTQSLAQSVKDLELAHQDIRTLLWVLNKIQHGEEQ